jgi:peptide-methionine (R)-S-oxide reductase
MSDQEDTPRPPIKTAMTEDEWRAKLSPVQYAVARCSATEPPFTGKYNNHKADGTYVCICCETPLFTSHHKYDSGSGWPSFWNPVNDAAIEEREDRTHGMIRTEICCRACGAHLGHVFTDGPRPTGLRYCVNSASLDFKPST